MPGKSWKIHKFGGSSLYDADCFKRVADIVRQQSSPRTGVVVSAMGGMTDQLLELTTQAERGDSNFSTELDEIGARVADAAGALLSASGKVQYLDAWSEDASDLKNILASIARDKSLTQRNRDIVSGFGELWSARLMAAYLGESLNAGAGGRWLDARKVITVHHGDLGPAVNWPKSEKNFASQMADFDEGVVVITGFIAVDEAGNHTTLGRNGSDFSAAIFAALTDAEELTIWTDVDGVLSGDPRRVPEARIINALSYNEAMELAYFGARVIHPQTLGPVISKNIPVLIRNTFCPDLPGSRIGSKIDGKHSVKGITAIDGMALVNLEGTGMIGVPGTADRLFAALKEAGVSVTLISQASSEHSICIAVPADVSARAADVIRGAFADELADGQIQKVEVTGNQSIIAIVGDKMAGAPGLAARFFASLGRAGINVRAIAQGSSERNISAVVDADESTRALRAVHSGFYLSSKTVSIGLIGPGLVGTELLDQIRQRYPTLHDDQQLDLRVRGIARSSRMLLGEQRINLESWRDELEASSLECDLARFVDHIDAEHLPHSVIIDCTSSSEVAARYDDWLARGIHVVTPNKKASSGPLDKYRALQTAAQQGNSHFFYETTVGAALPIVSTLRGLIDTGDRIRSINGILSGTLAYLFNVYDGSQAFSEIVRQAKASGYTEPDPRDDLSGTDVARKLIILAREMGQNLELGDFSVQNLVPEALRELPVTDFLDGLSKYDDDIHALYQQATAEGKVLRYVASLNNEGTAAVGLQKVATDNAMAHIRLTDNIVQFVTDRYSENPLVVQGPGAGPEVTASGVFGDLLRLSAYLQGTE